MNDYSQLEVPGPTITELSRPFWDAAQNGQLKIQHCTNCEHWIFYPRPICPNCWHDSLEWREASGSGEITSFSQIWKPGHPGWKAVVPYYVGLVKLAEGPTMLSHILDDTQTLTVGDPVEFQPTEIGDRVLPFFKKVKSKGAR